MEFRSTQKYTKYTCLCLRPCLAVVMADGAPSHTLKSIVLDVRAGMAALAATRDDHQRRYVAGLLRRDSVTLAEKCWERHVWLNTSDEWLTAHKDELDPEDLKQRDDRWILAFRQYGAAMDLLGQVLEALKAIPSSTPHPTASSSTVPLTQEAFL